MSNDYQTAAAAAQAARVERETIAREKATMLLAPTDEQVTQQMHTIKAVTLDHMIARRRLTGGDPATLEALRARATTTDPGRSTEIDPITMARKDN